MTKKNRSPRALTALAMFCAFQWSSASAKEAAHLATRLSALRGEVEALSAELGEKQATYRAELQGYSRQEADLSLEARRGETTMAKLRLAIETIRKKNAEVKTASEVLDPVLERGLNLMEGYVLKSLPFKTKARLNALSEIREKKKNHSLSTDQAINRLWAFVEDEMRMQRESVVYRQEIDFEGQLVLADVLRVGMVVMFFRLPNQGVGVVQPSEAGWRYVSADDPKIAQQIDVAFEQFAKQVRVGTFSLPIKMSHLETQQ